MSDVRLYNTPDGGEIDYVNGLASTDQGLETAAYLSLFGGNDDDRGIQADDALQWWGNWIEDDQERLLRSQFQALVQGLPVTSSNLRRLQDAASNDLSWMTGAGIADSVSVSMSIPGLNRIAVVVDIQVSTETYRFSFDEAWNNE